MTAALHTRPRRWADGRPPWWLAWVLALVPGLVARVLVGAELFNFEQLIAALLAGLVVLAVATRPAPFFAGLVAFLPFQLLITSALYSAGLPGGVARMLGLWKEVLVLGVLVAAWLRARDEPGSTDALDRVALAFVGLGTAYFLLPELIVGPLGASLSLDDRFLAWRYVVLPALLLVGCRRLRLTDGELRWLVRGTTALGVALGAIATIEFVASDWWNGLLVDTFGVNRYRSEVLGIDLARQGLSLIDIRVYGEVAGREIIRVGGPMVSHLTFSFVLLIPLGLLVERLVRQEVTTRVVLGVIGCGAGLLFTQTRAAIVGGIVLLLVALRPAPGRTSASRVRYGLLAASAIVVALPLVFSAGLADRFTEGDRFSDAVHEDRVDLALDAIRDHPIGLGLGMGSNTGGRDAPGAVSVENQLLDTAVQLGVLGSVLFVTQYALLVFALRRAAEPASPRARLLAYGVRNALLAMLIPLWFQQAFGIPEVSWVLFALAGAALGASEARQERTTAR